MDLQIMVLTAIVAYFGASIKNAIKEQTDWLKENEPAEDAGKGDSDEGN